MPTFDRRMLLVAGMAAAGTAAWGAEKTAAGARLQVHPQETLTDIPRDFCGLSVEKAQLSDPAYYHPANASLIAFHRRLSPQGVLRIGGNTSEFCWWQDGAHATAPVVRAAGLGQTDNWMPQHQTPISPSAVVHLRGFLDACGWSCIWGLNFGTGTPERNAAEAAFVARALGPRLKYFQIGNEPDFYREHNNRLRPAGWDFPDYLNEWTAMAQAIRAAVPRAAFGGPDVGSHPDWILAFAKQAPGRLGKGVVGLSGHYYASGPPDAPSVTIAHLLAPAAGVAARMDVLAAAAKAAGLPFRMTEGNSCYRGGKPGLSNALASALWGGDYMLTMAAHGCKGVHFHGGSGTMIARSLGDKLPGAKTAADQEQARQGAFYAPLAGNRQTGFAARPLFYAMMLVERFVGSRLVATAFETGGVNATAYAAQGRKGGLIALFNKDVRDLTVTIAPNGLGGRRATLWRLTGPALEATDGVTLAGRSVTAGTAAWTPAKTETLLYRGRVSVELPRASAALLTLGG